MSSFASNLASLARSKLHSVSSGSRDNISLHRWVLLKNSLVHDAYSDTNPSVAALHTTTDTDNDADFEDEEVDSIIDEGMFAFLFPDPGDASEDAGEAQVSEAQWLDSLLDSLSDSEDDAADLYYKASFVSADPQNESIALSTEASSPSSSYSDEFASLDSGPVPYPVPYPPVHPPLALPFDLESPSCYCSSGSYSFCHSHDIDDADDSVPDAIEDVSDDESDSLHTPFSRSRTSLNLADPASVPLPHEGHEPLIFSASNDAFPYSSDPLPYSNFNSEHSLPVYSPYHQNC